MVEETGVPRENHQPDTSHWQTLSHNVVSNTPRLYGGILTPNFVWHFFLHKKHTFSYWSNS
jgi:hypothetical protein